MKLIEALTSPYRWRNDFSTEMVEEEDWDTGEVEHVEKLSPVQMARFVTDEGVAYLWYARQSRYTPEYWEMAFGVEQGEDIRGATKLDIGLTGTGNSGRVFATVVDIINAFVEYDGDNYQVQHLAFTAKGKNRFEFYMRRLVPRIEGFKVASQRSSGDDEMEVILDRVF